MVYGFSGATFDPAVDGERLKSQYKVVFAFMREGGWHTLSEIAEKTGYPEASVSSRLRDMRKPKFGGHMLETRRAYGNQFEYRLMLRDR